MNHATTCLCCKIRNKNKEPRLAMRRGVCFACYTWLQEQRKLGQSEAEQIQHGLILPVGNHKKWKNNHNRIV